MLCVPVKSAGFFFFFSGTLAWRTCTHKQISALFFQLSDTTVIGLLGIQKISQEFGQSRSSIECLSCGSFLQEFPQFTATWPALASILWSLWPLTLGFCPHGLKVNHAEAHRSHSAQFLFVVTSLFQKNFWSFFTFFDWVYNVYNCDSFGPQRWRPEVS